MKCKYCFDPTNRKYAEYCELCVKWRRKQFLKKWEKKRYRRDKEKRLAMANNYYKTNRQNILAKKKVFYQTKKFRALKDLILTP